MVNHTQDTQRLAGTDRENRDLSGRAGIGGSRMKTFLEEAAAAVSITPFVGMLAIWAQLIPQL
jgi:hypothetical protein